MFTTMYKDQTAGDKVGENTSEEEFDFCNSETGQKFIIKWSPQEEMKFISQNRYGSPRMLSKSVPRRNRNTARYRINGSLNFDSGHPRNDRPFKSANSSSGKSSSDGERYLSRSAKIMRALNINCSPFDVRTKKINKSLNFDLSPSPKRLLNTERRSLSNVEIFNSSRAFKINKTLNFNTSSNDSSVTSTMGTSFDSTDENQNQTPSQQSRRVKKSLDYLTSDTIANVGSSDYNRNSPNISDDRIGDLIRIGTTPNLQSLKRSNKKFNIMNEMIVSTPRNLFHDFDNDENERPHTPENVVQAIPESMSAIKKSHRKERLSRQLVKSHTQQSEPHSDQSEIFADEPIVLSQTRERPSTPVLNDSNSSPSFEISSIKQSHKKDKSKKKPCACHSEDEISDTGSIFDYSEEQGYTSTSKICNRNASKESSSPQSSIENEYRFLNADKECIFTNLTEIDKNKKENKQQEMADSCSLNKTKKFGKDENYDTEKGSKESPSRISSNSSSPELRSTETSANEPTRNEEQSESSCRPATPENNINFLHHIMTSSIKRSHKKIKDQNKKKLLRSRALQRGIENIELQSINHPLPQTIAVSTRYHGEASVDAGATGNSSPKMDRSGTPENVNSSRLLLPLYSSVKKSHRKDKHKKIISQSVRRQKYFNRDGERATRIQNEPQNSSTDLSGSDLNDHALLGDDLDCKKKQRRSLVESPLTCGGEKPGRTADEQYESDEPTRLYDSSPPLNRISPNKRKKSLDGSMISRTSSASIKKKSSTLDYESAEEEFQIFTPIKKRRSLFVKPNMKKFSMEDDAKSNAVTTPKGSLEDIDVIRCVTPCMNQQNESSDSLEYHQFSTPNGDKVTVTRNANSTPNCEEQETNCDDSDNGRSTPKNRSTSALILQINSIKKSHRKDKRRSLISSEGPRFGRRDNECLKNDFRTSCDRSTHDLNSSCFESDTSVADAEFLEVVDFENPLPSTSYERITNSSANARNSSIIKTPPNCFKTKNYLRLLQSQSIKRSHKKDRDRKRKSLIILDPELSDDGSIFDEEDRSGDIGKDSSDTSKKINNESRVGNDENDTAQDTDTSMFDSSRVPESNQRSVTNVDSLKDSNGKDQNDDNVNDSSEESIYDPVDSCQSPADHNNRTETN